MTLFELYRQLQAKLGPAVGAGEAQAMSRVILDDLLGVSAVDITLNGQRVLEPETVIRATDIARRVIAGEPLQYVLGHARFMGMELKVTPAVLIPRPETAQLVDIITDRYGDRSDLHVLDIGTGSGCIAIALARALPFSTVDAVDISPEALDVARANAGTLKAKVSFIKADALDQSSMPAGCYDIIVSNPPYISASERKDMDARVYAHEPQSALFVPDDKPLLFYRAIAEYAHAHLSHDGMLFFEINPLFAADLCRMTAALGYADTDIIKDFRGIDRFAVIKP